ncbi:hypothetical protein CSQ89_08285 [Chitinimonas sp. BJB300]|nr:hypothetical protein CSQ89_08285 [Chitinimonas sp. BJB300]
MGYSRASSQSLTRAFPHYVQQGLFRRRFDLFAIVRLASQSWLIWSYVVPLLLKTGPWRGRQPMARAG